MADKRDRAALEDIVFSAKAILNYVKDISPEDFRSDLLVQDGVARRIGVISEAAGRLSTGLRHDHPEVPWGKIKGMRNIVIHEYDRVDLDFVWGVATEHAADLQDAISKIIEEEFE